MDETKKYLRPVAVYWPKFNTGSFPMAMQHSCKNRQQQRTKRLSGLLGVFNMPVVYAQEEHPASPDQYLQKTLLINAESEIDDETHVKVMECLATETGWDRVKTMYSKTSYGHWHQDLLLPAGVAFGSSTLLFFIMTSLGSRVARERFLEKNKAVRYETKFLAMRAYNDAVVVGGTKFGLRYTVKMSAFIGILIFATQTISRYRNKTSVSDFTAGAALAGAIVRSSLGLRGAVAGGIIAGVLGTIMGLPIVFLARKFDAGQDRRHYLELCEQFQSWATEAVETRVKS